MKNGLLINFSGHPLSPEAMEKFARHYEEVVQAKPITFDFSAPIEEQLEKLVTSLRCSIDGTRPITVIPPGQSTLSILLITYMHGLMGHFPAICYLELGDAGVYVPKAEFSINSNHVRASGRKFRAKMFAA